MDLNYIKDSVANLSLYDLKAGVRKVQNGKLVVTGHRNCCLIRLLTPTCIAVMNYTEMEAKVCSDMVVQCGAFLMGYHRFEKPRIMSHGALLLHSCRKLPMVPTASGFAHSIPANSV